MGHTTEPVVTEPVVGLKKKKDFSSKICGQGRMVFPCGPFHLNLFSVDPKL